MNKLKRLRNRWERFWMRFAGLDCMGRFATRLSVWFAPPYYGRGYMARMNKNGYFSPNCVVYHEKVTFGPNVFIGDRVVIFQAKDGGPVELDEQVYIYGETKIETGSGGAVKIGRNSHIHPRCQISAYKSRVIIGREVQVAANCAFYPYNHGIYPDQYIQAQPLESKGDIVIEDDTWLGYGVIVLDGVHIGKGAVIGAGSVVTRDIPEGAIAVGNPARVVNFRTNLSKLNMKQFKK